jgi:hypothetical protein
MTRTLFLILIALIAIGCQRRGGLTPEPDDPEPAADGDGDPPPRVRSTRRPAAGAACSGRDDCTSDQVCVDTRCRYRETSVAGEVLASAAESQAAAGDWAGAIESYEIAFRAFEAKGAPVPPEIVCGAAELMLRTAVDADARERGARNADLCFRTTVPGHPARLAVRNALARLRFEGLEIATFDREEAADRFFTQPRSRPSVDTAQTDVQMPDLEPREFPSHTAVREVLTGDTGRRAIAECFVQDWETRHERQASANLNLRFRTELIDHGDHDEHRPEVQVAQSTTAEDGFEPCLARALPTLFDLESRALRRPGEVWEQEIRITARLQ